MHVPFRLFHYRIVSAASFLALSVLLLNSCGSTSVSDVHPTQAITISVQPTGQIAPPGATATFSVVATSTAPLSYQWMDNNAKIAGATAASYTTPAIPADANIPSAVGSYAVVVSNSTTSVASNTVTLTAGPRPPKAGDLRYLVNEQITGPGFMTTDGGGTGELGVTTAYVDKALGSPLLLGQGLIDGMQCSWNFSYDSLPPNSPQLSVYYQLGFIQASGYSSPASYLQSITASNRVVNSMDIQANAIQPTPASPACVGVSWVQTKQAGEFDQRLESISSGNDQQTQIQAQATLDGTESRVITAVSFDLSGNVDLLSYGWTGDTTTAYETQTLIVPANQVNSTAISLAANGFFISAFGGNPTNGYIIVGTRVKGDPLPRPIKATGTTVGTPDSAYFTLVVWLQDLTSGASATIWEQ